MNGMVSYIIISIPKLVGRGKRTWNADLTPTGCVTWSKCWLIAKPIASCLSPLHPPGRQCSLWGQVRGLHGGWCAPHPCLWRDLPVPSEPEKSEGQGNSPWSTGWICSGKPVTIPFLVMPAFGYHLSVSGQVEEKRSIYPISRVLRLW